MITWTFHQLSLTGNHCCSWLVQNDFWEKFTQNSSRHGEWWGNWGCLVLPKASLKHQQKEYCGYFQHHLGMNVSSLGYIHPRIYSLRYSGSADLQHLWSTILSLSWVLRSKLTFGGCFVTNILLHWKDPNKCWWLTTSVDDCHRMVESSTSAGEILWLTFIQWEPVRQLKWNEMVTFMSTASFSRLMCSFSLSITVTSCVWPAHKQTGFLVWR